MRNTGGFFRWNVRIACFSQPSSQKVPENTEDGPSALEKALGKDGAAAWLKKVSVLITSSEYFIYTDLPELSYV